MNKKMYMLLPLLAAQAYHAQTVKDSTAAIEQVVITASRTKQKLVNVPQKLSVITASDINKTSSADVTDIIKKNTTVNVIQYPGLLSGIGIRGFRPQFSGLTQRTLLLVDGRPAGATNMGLLDQNFVERIEVLKGPASALYGSQAMGGVVNLITPKSTGPVHGKMSGSYGSFDTYTASVKAGGSIDKRFDFDVSGMFFKRASNYRTGKGNVFRKILKGDQAKQVYSIKRNGTIQDSLAYVNDEYGDGVTRPYTQYSYYTTSGRVGYKISSGWRVDLSSSSFVANNVESPGEITKNGTDAGLKDIYRYGGDLSITGTQGIHDLSFKAYLSSEKSNNFTVRNSKGEVIDNPFLSRITGYNWKGIQLRDQIHLGRHSITAGYDYNYAYGNLKVYSAPVGQQANEYTTSPNSSLVSNGIYVQGNLNFLDNKLILNPGARMDFTTFSILDTPGFINELQTGSKTTRFFSPSFSGQYRFFDRFAVHGSVGRAFVTPDASNIAGVTIIGKGTGKITINQGNPDLKNENSWSQDFGVKYNSNVILADITYFRTDVKDRITSRALPPETPMVIDGDKVMSVTNYFNSDKSYIRGLEFSFSYDFGAAAGRSYMLKPFVNVNHFFRYVDNSVTNGISQESLMTNIAKDNYIYGVDFGTAKFSGRLNGRYVGKRWDRNYNDVLRPLIELPSFMTIDANISYRINSVHEIGLYADNLTDENYYEKRGYNLAGRNFKIKYTFNF